MNNLSFKKILIVLLTFVYTLSLVGCSSAEKSGESNYSPVPESDESGTQIAESNEPSNVDKDSEDSIAYTLSGEIDSIDGMEFDNDVIITGENGMIRFTDCVFNGNLINKGKEGARVFVSENCSFAEGTECIIDSDIEEANISTDLPKFLIFCSVPDVVCKKAGAVVTTADQSIKMNGTEYSVDAAKYYMNESTADFVPYTNQEANMYNCSIWTENGETVQMHVAFFAEE